MKGRTIGHCRVPANAFRGGRDSGLGERMQELRRRPTLDPRPRPTPAPSPLAARLSPIPRTLADAWPQLRESERVAVLALAATFTDSRGGRVVRMRRDVFPLMRQVRAALSDAARLSHVAPPEPGKDDRS